MLLYECTALVYENNNTTILDILFYRAKEIASYVLKIDLV